MLVRFKLTRMDYYYSAFWTFLTSQAIWLTVLLIPFGFLITIVQPRTINQLLLITISGFLLMFVIFTLLVYLSVLLKINKNPSLLDSYQSIHLQSDGVYYFPKEGENGVFSQFIYQTRESPRHIYLYLTPKHIILLPKKEANVKELKLLLKSLIFNPATTQALTRR